MLRVGQEATNAAFQDHLTSIFSSLYLLPPYDAAVVTKNELYSCVNFHSHVLLKPKFRVKHSFFSTILVWDIPFIYNTRSRKELRSQALLFIDKNVYFVV